MIFYFILFLIIFLLYRLYKIYYIEEFTIGNEKCKPINISENLILNPHSDKINCVGNWIPGYNIDPDGWSKCTKTCGGGTQDRSFEVIISASNGGIECQYGDSASQTQECNIHNCQQDCVGRWSESTPCSQQCGSGTQSQIYIVEKPALYGGEECQDGYEPGDIKTTTCYEGDCPVDCHGSFGEWSNCEPFDKCGNGSKTRRYNVATSASNNGRECPHEDEYKESISCYIPCAQDCVGYWEPWSECNASCNSNGSQTRNFRVIQPLQNNGSCVNENGSQIQSCSGIPCPINCSGKWSSFSECSKTCGSGHQIRTYDVIHDAHYGGSNCSHSSGYVETQICNTLSCPIDCDGDWNEWSQCSHQCGASGTQTRDYVIKSEAQHNGSCVLSGSSQTKSCNTHRPCPINCVGYWEPWEDCIPTPGEQTTQSRKYTVEINASYGGINCPYENNDSQTQYCPYIPKPEDCKGDWTDWGICSASCNRGTHSREFIITDQGDPDGNCPYRGNVENRPCNTESCPIDCSGDWSSFSECNASCNGGTKHRTFVVENENYTGKSCSFVGGFVQRETCNNDPCPIDCVGTWIMTDHCNASCGGNSGTYTESYKVIQEAQHGGHCDHENGYERYINCSNNESCPIDCEGSFTDWSTCSASCNSGFKSQTYNITQNAEYGGQQCPYPDSLEVIQSCNDDACPEDCQGSWEPWSECSASCNQSGFRTRNFIVTTPAINNGSCSNKENPQTMKCDGDPCPEDCVGEWNEWSECSKSCGSGHKNRTYNIIEDAQHGGLNCPYPNTHEDIQICNTQSCPIDCVGHWDEWSRCSHQCGASGTQLRNYIVKSEAQHNGSCVLSGSSQTQSCNTDIACPQNCSGHFIVEEPCNSECGPGTIEYKYVISHQARDGGQECPYDNNYTFQTNCSKTPCPNDCEFTTTWSDCSQSCGDGEKIGTIEIIKTASNDGSCRYTDGQTINETCNTQACPIDCSGSFGGWSECSQSCGGGLKIRTYDVIEDAQHGGLSCDYPDGLVDIQTCNEDPCPIDCVGTWEFYTPCNASCGGHGGTYTESYKVIQPAQHGGNCDYEYGNKRDINCSNNEPCPIDCSGSFTQWSVCNASCGEELIFRTYNIEYDKQNGGEQCPFTNGHVEIQNCSHTPCPNVCEGDWVDISPCSLECGGGFKRQQFVPDQDGDCHNPYENITKSISCNTDVCPINCCGSYNEWSDCSSVCGNGNQFRTFNIIKHAQFNGSECSHRNGDIDTQICNEDPCPINCVGHWGELEEEFIPTSECDTETGIEYGTRKQTYTVETSASNGGTECQYEHNEEKFVQTERQCRVDCIGHWGEFGECMDSSCSTDDNSKKNFPEGMMTNEYVVTQTAKNNGSGCPYANGTILEQSCIKTPHTEDERCDCTGRTDKSVADGFYCDDIIHKVFSNNFSADRPHHEVICGTGPWRCEGKCNTDNCFDTGNRPTNMCWGGSRAQCFCKNSADNSDDGPNCD